MKHSPKTTKKMVAIKSPQSLLSRQDFQKLADIPVEGEWFANIDNEKTGRGIGIPSKPRLRY